MPDFNLAALSLAEMRDLKKSVAMSVTAAFALAA
jgi:hypothetical protein